MRQVIESKRVCQVRDRGRGERVGEVREWERERERERERARLMREREVLKGDIEKVKGTFLYFCCVMTMTRLRERADWNSFTFSGTPCISQAVPFLIPSKQHSDRQTDRQPDRETSPRATQP